MKENWFENKMNQKVQNMDHELNLDLAWDRLESARNKRKKRPIIWWFSGLGLILLAAILYWFASANVNGGFDQVGEKVTSGATSKHEVIDESNDSSITESEVILNGAGTTNNELTSINENIKESENTGIESQTIQEYKKATSANAKSKTTNQAQVNNDSNVGLNNGGLLDQANQSTQSIKKNETKSTDPIGVIKKITEKVEEKVKEKIEEKTDVKEELPIAESDNNQPEQKNIVATTKEEESKADANQAALDTSIAANEDEKSKDDTSKDDLVETPKVTETPKTPETPAVPPAPSIEVNKAGSWVLAANYQIAKGNKLRTSMDVSDFNFGEFIEAHHTSLMLRRESKRIFVQAGLQYGQYTSRMIREGAFTEAVVLENEVKEIDRTGEEPIFILGEIDGTQIGTIERTRFLKYRTLGFALGGGLVMPISKKYSAYVNSDLLIDMRVRNSGNAFVDTDPFNEETMDISLSEGFAPFILESVTRVGVTRKMTENLSFGIDLVGRVDLTNRLPLGDDGFGALSSHLYGLGAGVHLNYEF